MGLENDNPTAAPAPAPGPATTPRPSTVSELFEAASALTRRHLGALFWTAALVLVPTMTLAAAAETLLGGWVKAAALALTTAVLLLIEAPLTLACLRALGLTREPRGLQPSAIYLATLNRLGALVVVILLAEIAPLPFSCVFVGLFFYLRFCVALPALLVEGVGPIAALGRSYALTGAAIVESIVVLLVGGAAAAGLGVFMNGVATLVISLLVASVARASASGLAVQVTQVVTRVGYAALAATLWSVALPVLAALSAVLYRETRVREALALASAPAPAALGAGALPYRSTPGPSADPTATSPAAGAPSLDPIAPWPLDAEVAGASAAPHAGPDAAAPAWHALVTGLARTLGADLDGSGAGRRVDGVFVAFLAVVGGLFAYAGTGPARYERALGRASLCVAQADPGCAREALDAARSGGEQDVRYRIVEADAALLGGEQRQAQALLETMDPAREDYTFRGERKPMRPEVRAGLLLLRGDLAIARRRFDDALPELRAARLLVADPDLADARIARAEATRRRLREGTASGNAGTIAQLRADVDRLLELASSADTDVVQLRASDLQQRLQQLTSPEARSKLGLVLDMSRNVARAASTNARVSGAPRGWVRPAPTPPSRDYVSPGAPTWQHEANERRYQESLRQYERSLAAYTAEQQAESARRHDKMVEDDREQRAKLAEARRLADEAFTILQERGL